MKGLASSFIALLLAPVIALSGASNENGNLGSASELAAAVLTDSSIGLRPSARSDVERGLVDARVLAMLLVTARHHRLDSVGPFVNGHSYFVAGTRRVSNHVYGRAVDISMVDSALVSTSNPAAFDLAALIANLPSPIRPTELGSPWRIEVEGVATFTKGHGQHLHAGFKSPVWSMDPYNTAGGMAE